MTNHIEEQKIELLILDEARIPEEERNEILNHIDSCFGCKETYSRLKNFYKELEAEINAEPSTNDIKLSQKLQQEKSSLATKLLEEPKKAVKVYHGWIEITEPYFRTKIQKFVRFAKNHPKGFTGSLAFASIIAAVLLYTSTMKIKDYNPTYAWVENQVLYIQNAEGQILWTMNMSGIRNTNSNTHADLHQIKIILVNDVNGDLKNEVLITGDFLTDSGFPSDSLFCYNYSGNLIWKTGGWEFPQIDTRKWMHTKWSIKDFTVVRNNKKNESRLFVLANDKLYSPAVLLEINGRNGQVLQTFYNVGGSSVISNFDFDEDGQHELIIGGVNDPFRRAYIAVFDINKISGYSPSTKEYLPNDSSFGSYKYYVIFPFTKLGQLLGHTNYNSTTALHFSIDKFIAITEEALGRGVGKHTSTVLYTFDRTMKVKGVITGDGFNKNHQELIEEGKLNEELDESFYENLRNSVRYWDGEKFVDSVSVNKYHNFSSVGSISLIR